jgi:hypothetical protein
MLKNIVTYSPLMSQKMFGLCNLEVKKEKNALDKENTKKDAKKYCKILCYDISSFCGPYHHICYLSFENVQTSFIERTLKTCKYRILKREHEKEIFSKIYIQR